MLRRLGAAPATVKLSVVPCNVWANGFLEVKVGETRQMLCADEGGRDRGESEGEGGAKVGVQPVDESDDAGERHGFLHVEVEPIKAGKLDHAFEGRVEGLELRGWSVEACERAFGSATEHTEDLHAGGLELLDLFPKNLVLGAIVGVIVEGYVAGGVVEVNSCDDNVGGARLLGEKGKDRNISAVAVVGLVVDYYAWRLGWVEGRERRHEVLVEICEAEE